MHINALPEGVSVTESRVTENAALFRLERTEWISGNRFIVTVSSGENGHCAKWRRIAATERGYLPFELRLLSPEVHKAAIDAHPPYQGISGGAFGEWTLSLPDSPHIRLAFDIGLRDGSEGSDGVTFIVAVQDDEIFSSNITTSSEWKHFNLDLTPYQNQQS